MCAPRTRFLDFSISSRFKTNNKIQKAGANETAYANKQCPLERLSVKQPNSLHHHRLQHIQNRHHLLLRLPEECVSHTWIKAAESFEQLAEMGFKLRADCQD